ncbi:hypothetical protein FRB97_007063 [Tulasnella sp. 331]|nr:hypothetical protein FRB97_007063 [Tulasnella sp. 331]
MPTITVSAPEVAESLIPAKALPFDLMMTDYQTVGDLKDLIYLRFPKMTFERQRLTLVDPDKVLDDHMSIRTLGDATVYLEEMSEKATVKVVLRSDWKNWFLTAYFYFNRPNGSWVKSQMQVIAYTLITLHFLKREYETRQYVQVPGWSSYNVPDLARFCQVASVFSAD